MRAKDARIAELESEQSRLVAVAAKMQRKACTKEAGGPRTGVQFTSLVTLAQVRAKMEGMDGN